MLSVKISRRKAVRVFPLPVIALKRICPAAQKNMATDTTRNTGIQAVIRVGSSVYIRAKSSGQEKVNRAIGKASSKTSFSMWCMKGKLRDRKSVV